MIAIIAVFVISIAVRLRLLGNILGIEDYGNQPAKLNQIKKVK